MAYPKVVGSVTPPYDAYDDKLTAALSLEKEIAVLTEAYVESENQWNIDHANDVGFVSRNNVSVVPNYDTASVTISITMPLKPNAISLGLSEGIA